MTLPMTLPTTASLCASFWHRMCYRVRQFLQAALPVVDRRLLAEARTHLPQGWRPAFDRLRKPEKAHVLRLYAHIKQLDDLSPPEREQLTILALTHDIGKGILRPTLFLKVVKVLLHLPNRAHATAGAKLLRRLGAPATLIRRVRRHHDHPGDDALLARFQQLDDAL